jgi:4-amino-4-deoxy-L-arabinose transferase-like glycosyltransferase
MGPAALAALTALAAALRFHELDGHPLWLDESATYLCIVHLAERGPDSPHFVQATNLLYYTLLWLWTAVFGVDAVALRSFSALVGTACVPLAARLATRIAGRGAGLACAVVVALHPLHVHYSREARSYALWTLLLLVAISALWHAVQRRTPGTWCAVALAWLAACGAHVFTLYALPATLAAILWAPPGERRRAARQWSIAMGAVVAAAGLYGVLMVAPLASLGPAAWIAERQSSWTAFPESLWALLPSGIYPFHLHGLSLASERSVPWTSPWIALAAASLPIAICAAGAASLVERRAGRAHADWRPLAALALGPLALLWLQSLLFSATYLVGRYDLVAWPGAVLWTGCAVAALGRRHRAAAAAALVALALCAAVPLGRIAGYEGGARWHERRAAALAEVAVAGDLVIAFSTDADELAHALRMRAFGARVRSFPSWVDRQIAWIDTRADLAPERAAALATDARALLEEVKSTIAEGRAVYWLDDSLHLVQRDARAGLAEGLERAAEDGGFARVALNAELRLGRLVDASAR